MALTETYTQTDGSLGRPNKVDPAPVPDLTHYISMQEINKRGKAIAELAASLGVGGLAKELAPAIVVGNQAAGDVIGNCHYLDTGDGQAVADAISAAAAGQDVYIRPGTYTMSAPSFPMTATTGVRIRGAGSGGGGAAASRPTILSIPDNRDVDVFSMATGTAIEDLIISVPLPAASGRAGTWVVAVVSDFTRLQNVVIRGGGAYGTTGSDETLTDVIAISGNRAGVRLIDVRIDNWGDPRVDGGGMLKGIGITGAPEQYGFDQNAIVRPVIEGTSRGIQIGARNWNVRDPYIALDIETSGSIQDHNAIHIEPASALLRDVKIEGGHIQIPSVASGDYRGVWVIPGTALDVSSVLVSNLQVTCSSAVAGIVGIGYDETAASGNTALGRILGCHVAGCESGVFMDGPDRMIVLGNQLSANTTPIDQTGVTNSIIDHNIIV